MWGKRSGTLSIGGVAVTFCALLLPQCGSRSGLHDAGETETTAALAAPGSDDAAPGMDTASLVAPARCIEDWQTLYEADGNLSNALAVARGQVVFGEWELDDSLSSPLVSELRVLDDRSDRGHFQVLADAGLVSDIQIEGEEVLYLSDSQLFQVPIAGGSPKLLFDGLHRSAARARGAVLIQPQAFYWTQLETGGSRSSLWRQERRPAGQEYAERELVTSFDREGFASAELAVKDDTLVVAESNHAVAVAAENGAQRVLAAVRDGSLVGVDGSGAYYSRLANETRRGGEAFEYEILRAPVDGGSPRQFWHGPAGHLLTSVWASGSGWLATGQYYLGDRLPHAVIVQIDAAGTEHVLACAPDARSIVSRPVFSDGSLYVVTKGPGDRERVVEIALTPHGAAPR